MNTLDDDFFDKVYEIHNLDCKVLWAGFTIIAKDLSEYICVNAFSCKGIDCFQSVYTAVLTEERFYLKKCSPNLFKSLQDIRMDFDISLKAKICDFDKGPLEEIDDENMAWLSFPGWALVKGFRKKLMKELCDSGISFSQYEEGEISKEEIVKAITVHLLENTFTKDKFWYPFLIYLSLLIIKTSKRPFCEENSESCC